MQGYGGADECRRCRERSNPDAVQWPSAADPQDSEGAYWRRLLEQGAVSPECYTQQ